MTPERWQQIKETFSAAVDREPNEQAAFLDNACADDAVLRRDVESLLAYDGSDLRFAEAPAQLATELLADHHDQSMRGRRIGPYVVLGEIGRGGMGTVYLARRADDRYQKQVAIKVIKRGMDTDAILLRFRNEQQILADLDHPNIVKLLDAGTTEDGRSYFIMDYVKGLSMLAYCDARRLSIVERLKLFRDVCSGVAYAHAHRVLHRDLKPSNILVTDAGVPKLLDFGIATVLDPERRSETVERLAAVGPMTPEYASPEQVRREPLAAASDVYSLGVLLYELLTGRGPHSLVGRTAEDIARILSEEDPEKPSLVIGRIEKQSRVHDCDATPITPHAVAIARAGEPAKLRRRLARDLDAIVLMALRKEPARRYASVEQFSEEIGRCLEGRSVVARMDTLARRSMAVLTRKRTRVPRTALVMVLLVVLFGAQVSWRAATTERMFDSVAVLPLLNTSLDPDLEYLSDGVTESVIGSLSQLSRLKNVPGFGTVMHYKGQIPDARRVGRTLGVRAVLTGRVSLYGNRLTIGMELVDVADASRLWSKQYDGTLTNLAALQGELAVDVAEGLRLPMSMEEQHRLSAGHTDNSEAYRVFMLGRYYRNKPGVAAKTKSIEYFHQAVELDPEYGLAYAALADAYQAVVWAGTAAHDPKQIYPRAKEAALHALDLDDSLAEAYVSLATVKQWFEWDWSGADDAFKRALGLNPRSSSAHHRYGVYLTFMRRFDEGLATLKRAQQLDPLSLDINVDLGVAYHFARQPDRAVSQLRHALEIDPQFPRAHTILATIYAQEERGYPDAAAALQVSLQSIPALAAKTLLAKHYTWSGHRAHADAILNELLALAKRQYVAPTNIAEVYAVLGQKDRAFAWLEAAYEERTPGLLHVYANPIWERYGIRSDSRFPRLIRRMRLPPVEKNLSGSSP